MCVCVCVCVCVRARARCVGGSFRGGSNDLPTRMRKNRNGKPTNPTLPIFNHNHLVGRSCFSAKTSSRHFRTSTINTRSSARRRRTRTCAWLPSLCSCSTFRRAAATASAFSSASLRPSSTTQGVCVCALSRRSVSWVGTNPISTTMTRVSRPFRYLSFIHVYPPPSPSAQRQPYERVEHGQGLWAVALCADADRDGQRHSQDLDYPLPNHICRLPRVVNYAFTFLFGARGGEHGWQSVWFE